MSKKTIDEIAYAIQLIKSNIKKLGVEDPQMKIGLDTESYNAVIFSSHLDENNRASFRPSDLHGPQPSLNGVEIVPWYKERF